MKQDFFRLLRFWSSTPCWHCASRELYCARKGRIGRKDFLLPSFNDFLLQPATRAVLANMEIIEPTPIQAEAIPALLAGNDVVGQSATGSGKTLPMASPWWKG